MFFEVLDPYIWYHFCPCWHNVSGVGSLDRAGINFVSFILKGSRFKSSGEVWTESGAIHDVNNEHHQTKGLRSKIKAVMIQYIYRTQANDSMNVQMRFKIYRN